MADIPTVAPGTWIRLGRNAGVNAVICTVYAPEFVAHSGHLEVVYLDERDRAINEDVKWDGEHRIPVRDQPSGGYADRYQRLQEFVQILRRGRR